MERRLTMEFTTDSSFSTAMVRLLPNQNTITQVHQLYIVHQKDSLNKLINSQQKVNVTSLFMMTTEMCA